MKPDSFSKVGVDADLVAYSCSFATQEKTKGDLHNAIDELIGYVVSSTVVFAGEGNVSGYLTGSDNFRFDVAKTYPYKGNRKETEKPKWLADSREYMQDKYGFGVTVGCETDDKLAEEATSYYDPDAYVIASLDKDMFTIPGYKFNWRKGTFEYSTKHDALKFFYTQLLTGDTADNIVGLYRVGPRKAEKILDGALSEVEMYTRVLKAYSESPTLVGDPEERIVENGRLLHLCRYEGEIWKPPV